jgi:hypothetical protein
MSDESPIFSVPDGGEFTDASGNKRPTHRFVSFRYEAVENEAKSRATGRRVFERVLMMRQHYPGSKDTLDREMLRWPEGSEHYTVQEPEAWLVFREIAENWIAKQQEASAGTPLALLNLNVAEIAALKAAGIGSVEMLAALPDAGLRVVESARVLRDKAQRYLDAASDGAPLAKAEAAAAAARDEAAALRQELAEMRALLAARPVEDDAPRRRGRPPNREAA